MKYVTAWSDILPPGRTFWK